MFCFFMYYLKVVHKKKKKVRSKKLPNLFPSFFLHHFIIIQVFPSVLQSPAVVYINCNSILLVGAQLTADQQTL